MVALRVQRTRSLFPRAQLDAQGTKEACGPNEVMLDAMWRWASKFECNGVQDGPVWIPSDAITREYPPRS